MGNKIDIIIIRGCPGSGKSKTAKELTQYFSNGVRMEIDIIRDMVISANWTSQQEHISMLQASTKLVFEFLRLGFRPIIIVDTFSGDKLCRYLETLYEYDESLTIKIFGLFTTDEELQIRLNKRESTEFKDFLISKKLNNDVRRGIYNSEYQIDTTGLEPKQTAKKIVASIGINNEYR